MYVIKYLQLTQPQTLTFEKFNTEGLRVISGLPRFTTIENVPRHSRRKTIYERAEVYRSAQLQRTEFTEPERYILRRVRHILDDRAALPPLSSSLEDIAVIDRRPTAPNVG